MSICNQTSAQSAVPKWPKSQVPPKVGEYT